MNLIFEPKPDFGRIEKTILRQASDRAPVMELAVDQLVKEKLHLKARANIPGTIQRALISQASPVDLAEAYLVGQMGVKYALEGKSGYMVSLIRESQTPYSCTTGLAPLEKVANAVKPVPADYINEEGNYVNEKFLTYVTPLVGELPPSYVRFEKHLSGKLLEEYKR